ncbi:MAG: hypothetical protein KGO98_04230 [Rickettsiales bacterium]|nr:hypothetical protein [Rickettsiales bacterium]
MTKRKSSKEANNLKLEYLMKRYIPSEVSETSDCVFFVRNQQNDETSKTLKEPWKERKIATDRLCELLKLEIIYCLYD